MNGKTDKDISQRAVSPVGQDEGCDHRDTSGPILPQPPNELNGSSECELPVLRGSGIPLIELEWWDNHMREKPSSGAPVRPGNRLPSGDGEQPAGPRSLVSRGKEHAHQLSGEEQHNTSQVS